MAQPHVQLALATQFVDLDGNPQHGLRFWLRLAGGKTQAELPRTAKPLRMVLGRFATGWATPEELQQLLASDAVADMELAEPLLLEYDR